MPFPLAWLPTSVKEGAPLMPSPAAATALPLKWLRARVVGHGPLEVDAEVSGVREGRVGQRDVGRVDVDRVAPPVTAVAHLDMLQDAACARVGEIQPSPVSGQGCDGASVRVAAGRVIVVRSENDRLAGRADRRQSTVHRDLVVRVLHLHHDAGQHSQSHSGGDVDARGYHVGVAGRGPDGPSREWSRPHR